MAESEPRIADKSTQQQAVEDLERRYQRLFRTDDGQAVLEDLAGVCHIFSSTFVAGDPTGTAVNEGMRTVFLLIMEKAGMTMTKLYLKRAELERTSDAAPATS